LRIAGLGFAILGRQKPPRARRAREGWNHEGHEEHEGEARRTNGTDRMCQFRIFDWGLRMREEKPQRARRAESKGGMKPRRTRSARRRRRQDKQDEQDGWILDWEGATRGSNPFIARACSKRQKIIANSLWRTQRTQRRKRFSFGGLPRNVPLFFSGRIMA